MKKLYFLVTALAFATLSSAQNTFPASGNVGIGTTSPTVPLDIIASNAQVRLQGVGSGTSQMDVQIKRLSSGDYAFRGPNIGFVDATGGGIIQGYMGNLQFWPGYNKIATMTPSGVGVGTASPVSLFQVNDKGAKLSIGSANNATLLGTGYVGFNAGRAPSGTTWTFDWNLTGSGAGGAVMYGDVTGNLNFATVPTLSSPGNYFTLTDAQIKSYVSMQLTSAGVLRAKRIKVEATGWPDYVFSKGYKLPTLESVNAYIQKNHHLPEMPSANEVHTEGQDLGEMNKLLLKKVEELTLYLIEKDKNEKQQQIEIGQLRKRLDALSNAVKGLHQ